MVTNHGEFSSRKDRVVGPLPFMAFLWLINGGDPNHLLAGMILQVPPTRNGLWKPIGFP